MATTKKVALTGPCPWLVQVASGHPEPDSEADLWDIVECGAPSTQFEDGSFECEAGHFRGILEEELGAGGYEYQREMEERYS